MELKNMKLKEYLSHMAPDAELTCWDKDIDSEFYFYAVSSEEEYAGAEFPNVNACVRLLSEILDVVAVHEHGVEVNLYEKLSHPAVVQYAKDNLYEPHQYYNDDDVVMMLFDDNVLNISQGYEILSGHMVSCLRDVYCPSPILPTPSEDLSFIDDEEKMVDFLDLSKEEFLASYSYLSEAEYDATKRVAIQRGLCPAVEVVPSQPRHNDIELWARVGVSLRVSPETFEALKRGDQDVMLRVLRGEEGRVWLNGETYFPDIELNAGLEEGEFHFGEAEPPAFVPFDDVVEQATLRCLSNEDTADKDAGKESFDFLDK